MVDCTRPTYDCKVDEFAGSLAYGSALTSVRWLLRWDPDGTILRLGLAFPDSILEIFGMLASVYLEIVSMAFTYTDDFRRLMAIQEVSRYWLNSMEHVASTMMYPIFNGAFFFPLYDFKGISVESSEEGLNKAKQDGQSINRLERLISNGTQHQ